MQNSFHKFSANRMLGKSIAGFSLMELMIVVGIIGVLASFALPNFRIFILNNRIETAINDFELALRLARSEATKSGLVVMVCPSNNTNLAAPTCSNSPTDWANGLLIYSAPFQSIAAAAPRAYTAGDTLIKQTPINFVGTISSTGSQDAFISFQNNGLFFPSGGTIDVALCDSRGVNDGRGLRLTSVGKIRDVKLSDFPNVDCIQ